MAVYPASILAWTQRVNSQTIFAADPNALAAEIAAIETFVGANPHIESSAKAGATKTFTNMSARVSDAMLQNGHPVVSVFRTTAVNIPHSTSSTHTVNVPFNQTAKSWPGYIGAGGAVTVKDAGLWLVQCHTTWDYATTGWVQTLLYGGGTQLDRNVFSYSQFPQSGANTYGERFINQFGNTNCIYFGYLNAGVVLTSTAGNYTNRNPLPLLNSRLTAYFIRP